MHSCSVKLLALSVVLSAASLFSASSQSGFPNLIVKTIYNNTSYNLLLIDRLAKNKGIILPAGKTVEVNFKVNDQNEVIIQGDMAECMAQDAQYVFKKLDQDGNLELDQEVYFNMHTKETNKSLALRFYMAGKYGGCLMTGRQLNADDSKTAEFELELSRDKTNEMRYPFKMNRNGNIAFFIGIERVR
jgi:hypothetical protein